ncbi:hypothetical protein QZM64_14190 [Burkholderia cepacia]|nr:hypothetical protein [Burkholderia cepacia]MDN7440311.1 hypothetical protein [Burkholderia cepacia]
MPLAAHAQWNITLGQLPVVACAEIATQATRTADFAEIGACSGDYGQLPASNDRVG